MKKFNISKLPAVLLSLAIAITMLICVPLTAEAASGETAVTVMQDTPGKWERDGIQWRFILPDGSYAASMWVAYSNEWYYIKADGLMADDEWVDYKDNLYFIKPGGIMARSEWIKLDGTWYWFNSSGELVTNKWLKYNDKWYWLKADGTMASAETLVINGKTYSFYAGGAWIEPPKMTDREAAYAAEVLRLTNIERESRGLAPLTSDNDILKQAAILRAVELEQEFGHIRPDGRAFGTAYVDLGGSANEVWHIWENGYWIWGTDSADAGRAVNWWMNSPEHRDNLLNPDHTQLGVGVYITSKNIRCIQLFYSN